MSVSRLHSRGIHYRLDGPERAPVLALSNSLGTSLGMWSEQMDALAQHFRVLRYDTRGHGNSEAPAGTYSNTQLGEDVLGLLDELDVERAHFCGISMGGMTGIWLGINAPERLHRLVLCNTAAKIGTAEVWNQRIEQVEERGMPGIVDSVVQRWFTESFRDSHPGTVDRIKARFVDTLPQGYIGCCAAIRDADQRQDLSRISVPTLVVSGTHDAVTTPEDARFLAERIPNARYVELAAAHLSNIEAAAAFNRELINFLTEEAGDG